MVKIHKDSVYLDLLDHTSPENSSKPSIDVMFEDRKDAGQKLGKELEKEGSVQIWYLQFLEVVCLWVERLQII